MTSSQKKRVGVVLACVILAVIVLLPTLVKDGLPESWPSEPIKLGLDLKGGSYLVLGVETEEAVKSRLRSMGTEIRAELRRDKVRVRRAKPVDSRTLEVQLVNPRAKPKLLAYVREQYKELIYKSDPELESKNRFRFTMREDRAVEVKRSSVEQAIETVRNRVDQYGVAEPTIQRAGEERIMVQLPDVTNIETVKETIGKVARLEFRLVSDPTKPSSVGTVKRNHKDGGEIILEDEILMTGDVIDRANVSINPQTNEAEVLLKLNSIGSRQFERITGQNVERQLAIVLDDVVQSSPRINERIPGGQASITGSFTPEESHLLAIVLRAGALPAPLNFLEERTVGSTLGADSIRQGVSALLLGTILVIIFTMIYYKKAGVLAVGCLILNMLFLLGLLALLGATLTLPGLAGLVLTIGMAVDANIIIFERIKEELAAGSSATASASGGFLKAHWTILDANITTLLTGLILYGFGTGPIRGFAVTLCLGILTSVFSALFVAKVGFEVLKLKNKEGSLSI